MALRLPGVKAKQELVPHPVTKDSIQNLMFFVLGGLQASGNQQELLAAGEWRLSGFGELHYILLCF